MLPRNDWKTVGSATDITTTSSFVQVINKSDEEEVKYLIIYR